MCAIAPLIAVASAGIGVMSSLQQGKAAMAAAQTNAAGLRSQAVSAENKAAADAAQSRTRYERDKGVVESRIGTTGIDAGSFSDVLADDASEAALERALIRASGKAAANNLNFQAEAALAQGRDAKRASYLNAASSVVGAFSSAFKPGSGISGTGGVSSFGLNGAGVSLNSRFAYGG